MSSNQVKCPNCAHLFNVEEALSKDIETQIRSQYHEQYNKKQEILDKEKKEFEEKRSKAQEEYKSRLETDRQQIIKEETEKASKKSLEEFQFRLKNQQEELEKRKKENSELKEKELVFLKREEQLKEKEKEIDLQVQRKLKEGSTLLEDKITKQEQEKNELIVKELQKKLEDQKKLTEEMKRKQEQGSMQLQGEVQELVLEALLKETFPFDLIEEVGKGVRGADCVQTVRNNVGQVCGKIIYESKRTQSFANDWIEKLKADMRAQNADIAVIVTQTMPKDMTQFGERNGIWICTYSEVRALAHVLRNGVLKVAAVTKSQENKGDKMQLLYDYLTGKEFGEQWKAIREGFMAMKQSIDTERSAMERLWKAREKQLEKILLNASHISGSVEGISGMENVDLNLLGNSNLLE